MLASNWGFPAALLPNPTEERYFRACFSRCTSHLRELFGVPESYEILFLASATEIWERIAQNLVESRAHHFVNGAFGDKFYRVMRAYHPDATLTRMEDGKPFPSLEMPAGTELVSLTLNETSNGFRFLNRDIAALRADHPDVLIAADVVSVAPFHGFDIRLVDAFYFSVQKCFGLPAGLGVWMVSPRCLEKSSTLEEKGICTGSYHRLGELSRMARKCQTPETPNVLGIWMLDAVVTDMLGVGLEDLHARMGDRAERTYRVASTSRRLRPFIDVAQNRSETVVVLEVEGGNEELLQDLKGRGMRVGRGYGVHGDSHIRIANFPALSDRDYFGLLDRVGKILGTSKK